MSFLNYHIILLNCRFKISSSSSSSSSINLRPLGLFLPPGKHLPISFVVFLYFFSFQVCNLIFLGNLLSSILCICCLQCILYYVNFSLTSKIPNCSLVSLFLFLFCPKVYIIPLVLKTSFQQLQFPSGLIGYGPVLTAIHQNRDCHHLIKFNLS